jgi:hypothetical protein
MLPKNAIYVLWGTNNGAKTLWAVGSWESDVECGVPGGPTSDRWRDFERKPRLLADPTAILRIFLRLRVALPSVARTQITYFSAS